MYFSRIFIRFSHTKPTFQNLTVKTKAKAQADLRNLLITMPKEQPHIPVLKSQRINKKKQATKYPAGYITLQILGNGSKGAPSSLYMFTDQTRYIFNCGEGSQRLAHEHKMKLAKLEHVFVTSSSWRQIGGLPGVALTIQDIGVPCITLHGPPNLEKLFEGTRRFVILKNLNIKVEDCVSNEAKFFDDSVMRVDYVPIHQDPKMAGNSDSKNFEISKDETPIEEDQIDYYERIKGCKRHLEIQGGTIAKKPKSSNEENGYPRSILAYIVRPKKKPGTLLIAKCVEKGVPPGPLLGKLKSGQDVTLPNGYVVKASEVTSPDFPSPTFLVVDCPDESYLDPFITNPKLLPFLTATSEEDFAHTVVHFTPKEILTNPKYMKWIQSFHCSTRHILINELCSGMGSEAVHKVQYKLNLLEENVFPLLKDQMPLAAEGGESVKPEEVEKKQQLLEQFQVPIMTTSTLFKYNLRPVAGPDEYQVVKISPESYLSEARASENFDNLLTELKAEIGSPSGAEEFPKFLFLGTGSCIPNKTRNTSGILVQVSKDTNVILDCGEGTYGQLARFFGPAEVDDILINLKAIYVSHLHADHHLGLINLLQHRFQAFQSKNLSFYPLYLIAPHQIQSWLLLYHKNFEPLKHLYDLVAVTSLLYQNQSLEPNFQTQFYNQLEMNAIESVGVRHCPNAYGIALTGAKGWKLTYSGDTMPSDYLVTLGQGSDILIHEATMEDELAQEAVLKQHSTTSEAICIGKRMGAKFILLTHFSQRYSKVPKLTSGPNNEGTWIDSNVGIAFDNMRVGLGDLEKITKMYPILKVLFAESIEEMEYKSSRKQFKKEREMRKLESVSGSGSDDGQIQDQVEAQSVV